MKLYLIDKALLCIRINIHSIDILDKLEAAVLACISEISAFLFKELCIGLTNLGVYLADISLEHIGRSVVLVFVYLFKENDKVCTAHRIDILGKLCVILNLEICNGIVYLLDVWECHLGDIIALGYLLLDFTQLLDIQLGNIAAEL